MWNLDSYSYNKTNEMHWFLRFVFGIKLYMFRTVSLSIVRSLALYTWQQVYVVQVLLMLIRSLALYTRQQVYVVQVLLMLIRSLALYTRQQVYVVQVLLMLLVGSC